MSVGPGLYARTTFAHRENQSLDEAVADAIVRVLDAYDDAYSANGVVDLVTDALCIPAAWVRSGLEYAIAKGWVRAWAGDESLRDMIVLHRAEDAQIKFGSAAYLRFSVDPDAIANEFRAVEERIVVVESAR